MNDVQKHFDNIAPQYDRYKKKNRYYYLQLKNLLKKMIPPVKIVLEIGCGTGDLLETVSPKLGIGIDISRAMIHIAAGKHPDKNLKFIAADIRTYQSAIRFDYIFMSDVIEHLTDTEECIESIARLMDKNTKFLITMANPGWEGVLALAEKLGLKMPEGPHKRISYSQIKAIMAKFGLKIICHSRDTLFPVNLPIITFIVNKYLGKLLQKYAFIEYIETQKN